MNVLTALQNDIWIWQKYYSFIFQADLLLNTKQFSGVCLSVHVDISSHWPRAWQTCFYQANFRSFWALSISIAPCGNLQQWAEISWFVQHRSLETVNIHSHVCTKVLWCSIFAVLDMGCPVPWRIYKSIR